MGHTSKEEHNDVWVFLSHSNKDYEKVRMVRNILEEYNFRPIMFFLKCLNDSDEVDQLIKREINCRTRFILCDSSNARKSKWVQREVDYIKEQQRTYYTLDMSKTKDAIAKDIKEFSSNSTIFFSAPREIWDLAGALVDRVRRYDFNVFFDVTTIYRNAEFEKVISDQMDRAKSYGLFVCLVTKDTFDPRRGSHSELQLALEKGNRIVPILVEQNLPRTPLLETLKSKEYIDVSGCESQDEVIENALRHILTITHQPGSILTLAENFIKEESPKKFKPEIDLCGRIVLNSASEKPSNYSLLYLKGKCYEKGIGTDKDLNKAYDCYSEAYNKGGIESAKKEMQRLAKALTIAQKKWRILSSLRNFLKGV